MITISERKAMVLAFGYALSIEHSAFSTLCFFNTPHFQHSAFSTLRVFNTLHFQHSAFSTLRIFNTPHFQHSAFLTLRIFNTAGLRTPGLRHSAFSCKPITIINYCKSECPFDQVGEPCCLLPSGDMPSKIPNLHSQKTFDT